MSGEKKKTPVGESTPKSSLSKSMKKSSKSRTRTPKPESSRSSSNGQSPASSTIAGTSSVPEMPTTPTSSTEISKDRSHHRGYAAFGPRTIKIIWEQHDTSDTDLPQDLLPILAEDASYKVWELAKNIKTYSMHSGGFVTSDLVNEVLKDCDCPPVLGSMDTEWDRIDYDGSFYFNSDKIIELRSEYQKDVQITMPIETPFRSTWPIQAGSRDMIQAFMQSIFLITLGGNEQDFDSVRQYIYCASFIGSCYRVLLNKMIQTLAFKQTNHVKQRCWRLMQTLVQHPSCKNISCREEYFHLAEILICQLMDTYEAVPLAVKAEIFVEEDIKRINSPVEGEESVSNTESLAEIKVEDVKAEGEEISTEREDERKEVDSPEVKQEFLPVEDEVSQAEHVYRLERDDEDDENIGDQMEGIEFSPYSADKVDFELVDELCETIGFIGATNEFFNTECMHLILRRLQRFFDKRETFLSKDYEMVSRAIRGLFALGEYAFREFIPYMEQMEIMNSETIPDSLRVEFAPCAIFLHGQDDIFLYEWLNELCAERLRPFMTHYARQHQKVITKRHLKRRLATFKIIPKVSAKRVSLPPSKSPKKECPSMDDVFPEREIPVTSNSSMRFKFAGCRQIPVKIKPSRTQPVADETSGTKPITSPRSILIARRKLFKPLTDEQKSVHISNYHLLRI